VCVCFTYLSKLETIADDDPLPLKELAKSLIESIGIATETVGDGPLEAPSTSITPSRSLHLSRVA
jgi:hypothetical protein